MIILEVLKNDYSEVITQIIEPRNLFFEQQINETRLLSFDFDGDDKLGKELIQYQKVRLYDENCNGRKLIWTGFISDIEATMNINKVICYDSLRYLKRKIYIDNSSIFNDKSYFEKTVSFIMSDLMGVCNARSGENLTVSSSSTKKISYDYKAGVTLWRVANDLAKEINGEFKMQDNLLIIEENIGVDQSEGLDIVEFVIDCDSPQSNNISNYKVNYNGQEISTFVYGQSSNNSRYKKTGNTSIFGYIEKAIRVPDGVNSQSYMDTESLRRSETIKTFSFDVDPFSFDYTRINIGDIVRLRVNTLNPLANIWGKFKVQYKRIEYVNGIAVAKYRVGKTPLEILDNNQYISDLEDRVQNLEFN